MIRGRGMKKSQAERIKDAYKILNTEGTINVLTLIAAVTLRHYRHTESPEEAAAILDTFLKLADIVKPYNDRFFIEQLAEMNKNPLYIKGKEPKEAVYFTDEPDADPDELKALKRAKRKAAKK